MTEPIIDQQAPDKADLDIDKIELLAKRIDEYKRHVEGVITHSVTEHNTWLDRIENTGFNDVDVDPLDLGPMMISRIETWYSFARKCAYEIAGKCRDLQKFYEAVAEQGQANQYERVKLGKENSKLHNSTDAQYLSRRIKGRLLEKAAHWEGEFKRWSGIGDSYEQTGNAVKDMFKLAEYELQKDRSAGQYR